MVSSEGVSDSGTISENEEIRQKQVYEKCMKLIKGWNRPGEVWALNFGIPLLSATAILPCLEVCQKTFNLCQIQPSSKIVLPAIIPSILLSYSIVRMAQKQMVERDIVLGITKCPTCVEIRATWIQLGSGVLVPSAMTALASTHFIKKSAGGLPRKYSAFSTWQFMQNVLRKNKSSLMLHAGGQFLLLHTYLYFAREQWYSIVDQMNRANM